MIKVYLCQILQAPKIAKLNILPNKRATQLYKSLANCEAKFSITTTNCIINKATIHPRETKKEFFYSFLKYQHFVFEDFKVLYVEMIYQGLKG